MTILGISSAAVVVPGVLSTGSTLATTSSKPDTDTPASAPVDTVALSPEAQQSLATATVPPSDVSSLPDAITQAISDLNNTDGSVSVDAQLQAYDLTVNFVSGGGTATDPGIAYDPSKTDAMVALLGSPFAQHVQQVLDTVNPPKDSYADFTDGNQAANAIDTSLVAFNALSPSDQQIYVDANNLGLQLDGNAPLGTADDYRANQAARADVDRALQAAMSNPAYATALTKTENSLAESACGVPQNFGNRASDLGVLAAAAGDQATVALVNLAQGSQDTADWTQQVQAYFAANGPPPAPVPTAPIVGQYSFGGNGSNGLSNAYGSLQPPAGYQPPDGKTLVAALAATWDTSGRVLVTDQIAAQKTLDENFLFRQNAMSPATFAVFGRLGLSPFQEKSNAAAASFFWNPAVMAAASGNTDPPPSQTELGLLNALPAEQQQLIFAGAGVNVPNQDYAGGTMIYAANLGDWKAQLAQQAVTNHNMYLADRAAASAPIASSTGSGAVSAAPTNVNANSGAAKALAMLTAPKSSSSNAQVALTILQNAAKSIIAARLANATSAGNAMSSLSFPSTPVARYDAVHKTGSAISVTT